MNKLNSLANKGRYGDTTLRKVDNELAHVNELEARLIDSYGSDGEKIVKDIGSGTINPETGLKEYHYWHSHGPHKTGIDFVDWTFGEESLLNNFVSGFQGAGESIVDLATGEGDLKDVWNETIGKDGIGGAAKDAWNYVLPTAGTKWFSNEPNKEQAKKDHIKSATHEAMAGLQSQLTDYMGEGGYIAEEKELRDEGLKMDYDTNVATTNTNMRNVIMSSTQKKGVSGLESSKMDWTNQLTLNEIGNTATGNTDRYGLARKESMLTYDRARTDVVAGIRDKMNNLSMQYIDAIGKEISGGDYQDLIDLLDEYEGGV